MQVAATNYAKKKVLGKASGHLYQQKPNFETDPEIIAATQEAAARQQHHWWKRNKTFTHEMLLSKHDRKILYQVKTRAWYLDKGFHCCCFQIGFDGIVGLIPGIGDFIGSAFSLQLIKTACKANLPNELIAKMMINVMIDFVIGLTPIAGDILDIMFKCNWRNALLLEEYLMMRRRDEIRLEKGEAAVAAVSAAAAVMDGHLHLIQAGGTTATGSNPSSSSSPAPAYHNTVTPMITKVDDDGNEIVEVQDGTKKKKKYGTFFTKWGS